MARGLRCFWGLDTHPSRTKYIRIPARAYTRGHMCITRGRNIWRFTYLFRHNEFHAWSVANHAKVITGTQITGGSCALKWTYLATCYADCPRYRWPACHVVVEVEKKNGKILAEKFWTEMRYDCGPDPQILVTWQFEFLGFIEIFLNYRFDLKSETNFCWGNKILLNFPVNSVLSSHAFIASLAFIEFSCKTYWQIVMSNNKEDK